MNEVDDQTDFAERRAQALWWQCIAVAVIATLALAPWDVAISRAVFIAHPSGLVSGLLKFVEKLGNGGGVVAMLVALVILDRRVVGRVPQLLAASLGAGLIADCLKLCVDRGRPYSLDLSTATFTSTFHGWLPLFSTKSAEQGFPSGHATTAAGLAIALALLYPRGRWLFGLVVAAVMAQRIVVHAHFPTDVMVGAIVGAVWARQCHRGAMGRKFASIADKIDDMIAERVNKKSRKVWGLGADVSVPGPIVSPRSTSPTGDVAIPEPTPRRRSA
ncbi:MAG TPA: phosphatase PAP2 family protein [Lacipirellulaceae bacterium]|jgi:membrane-associated phospholipid phosphatase